LRAKGIAFGRITARPDGTFDTAEVRGVDPDLRVKPFFAHGATTSIREFVVGALNDEMGLQAVDPLLLAASRGGTVVTPTGMRLDGRLDTMKGPKALSSMDDPDLDGVRNEIPPALVDYLEFYLFNYFKPGRYQGSPLAPLGQILLKTSECTSCHVQNLTVANDRRIADVETRSDPQRGIFNGLFATASLLISAVDDGTGHPSIKLPNNRPFVVENIFSDFRRHDIGPGFYERNYDGTLRKEFMTTPLWGVGSTSPYGHDGRSVNLREVILRHGGAAQASRNKFAALPEGAKLAIIEYLNTLVLFPPDDTASNLDPGDPSNPSFPQRGHGSIRLTTLFNDPSDVE
jgi:hypothetical protein